MRGYESLTGSLLLRPQVRHRQLRRVALQPHEKLLQETPQVNMINWQANRRRGLRELCCSRAVQDVVNVSNDPAH